MKMFKADKLSKQQNYKLLSGGIIPRPIAFVTSQDKVGHLNAAPFSFFNVVCSAPPMIMLSIGRANGQRKDSSLNIEETQCFVVHITDESTVEQINETAAPMHRTQNELDRTHFTCIDSECVSVPGIAEAKIRMECHLERIVSLGDVDEGSDLIIGRVEVFHIDDDVYIEDSKIEPQSLKPVGRLAGHDYMSLGNTFTIKRPTE